MTSTDATSAANGAPANGFKTALAAGETLFGFWQGLTCPETVEISAHAGFDWLLLDGEHAPNDMAMLRDQLRATLGGTGHPVVRTVASDAWMIKQALDIGAQTLLVPMIDTADMARAVVSACRYAPEGTRGVGAALARASGFGRRTGYLQTANDEVCVLIQVESRKAVENLDEILAVDGVDGVFVGPADLSADMGYRGQPAHPEMQALLWDLVRRIRAAGRAPGILLGDAALVEKARDAGAQFIAVGSDVGVFNRGAQALAAQYRR